MIKRFKIIFSLLTLNSVILFEQTNTIQPLRLDFELVSVSRCNDYNNFYMDKYGNQYSNMIGILQLTNQTDSTFSFWIMNCSWTDLVKIEPDSILLEVKECDTNYPVKISLESHQSLSFNSIIEIPSDYFDKSVMQYYNDYKFNTFKIGFMIIGENEFTRYPNYNWHDLIDDKRDKNQFIWSQPIDIKYSVYGWKINN